MIRHEDVQWFLDALSGFPLGFRQARRLVVGLLSPVLWSIRVRRFDVEIIAMAWMAAIQRYLRERLEP